MKKSSFTLKPFDRAEPREVKDISVKGNVCREGDGIVLSYHLQSRESMIADKVNIPEWPRCADRCDGLWEHTCLECFVARSEENQYWEYNVAPSGSWNVYRFHGYRIGGETTTEIRRPTIESVISGRTWSARIRMQLPVMVHAWKVLQLGITAVLEHPRGQLSYWALDHETTRPDFHCRKTFLVEIANDD